MDQAIGPGKAALSLRFRKKVSFPWDALCSPGQSPLDSPPLPQTSLKTV